MSKKFQKTDSKPKPKSKKARKDWDKIKRAQRAEREVKWTLDKGR